MHPEELRPELDRPRLGVRHQALQVSALTPLVPGALQLPEHPTDLCTAILTCHGGIDSVWTSYQAIFPMLYTPLSLKIDSVWTSYQASCARCQRPVVVMSGILRISHARVTRAPACAQRRTGVWDRARNGRKREYERLPQMTGHRAERPGTSGKKQ